MDEAGRTAWLVELHDELPCRVPAMLHRRGGRSPSVPNDRLRRQFST